MQQLRRHCSKTFASRIAPKVVRQSGAQRNTDEAGLLKVALGELEALAGAFLAVLLAFLHARIAGEKTVRAQRGTKFRVETRNGARKPMRTAPACPPMPPPWTVITTST